MSNKDLAKKLAIVGSVCCHNWDNVPALLDNMPKIKVLEKEWHNEKASYPDLYPLDLSKIKTWSTYRDCADLTFRISSGKLICNAVIYDGDGAYGKPTYKRFSARLQLPMSFISELSGVIDGAFHRHCVKAYEADLEKQKQEWIEQYARTLLGEKC